MRILFIGDIFGRPGRTIVREKLKHLVREHQIDLVLANGENSAAGFGITPSLAEDLFDLGIDVLTTGNHVWDKREIVDYFLAADADPSRVFSTRWLAGSLALLTPPKVERAGEVVPSLARLLLDGSDLFAHTLCDLTGFELIGEHASAAACMDAVVLVGRAHATYEKTLLGLEKLMPPERFLGVLLVG